MDDTNPTARALICLEVLLDGVGVSAARLAARLGVSERAARRYVAILREAGLPVESTRGPGGGYGLGRGMRPRPLMFTVTEALGLVMAVLEGGHAATDATDPVQSALAKILRMLPEPVARPAELMRAVAAARHQPGETPDPATAVRLVEACAAGRRVRLTYRFANGRDSVMDVDPWAVIVRFGRWYLLGWSHSRGARRTLRVDRIAACQPLDDRFTAPPDLDMIATLDEHLTQGWTHRIEVTIDAPLDEAAHWVPGGLGRLDACGPDRTRLTGSTDDLAWYAAHLAFLPVAYRIVEPPELREVARAASDRLAAAAR